MRRPTIANALTAAALLALLLAGCSGGPVGAPASAPRPSAVPDAAPPGTAPATLAPSPSVPASANDAAIAERIRADAAVAIPQLKRLNKLDPGKLEELFLPLGSWIETAKEELERLGPGGCTDPAAALFLEALDSYDDIRQTFLEWRDWGAHGHPFSPGAPALVVKGLEAALTQLEVGCPSGSV